MTLETGVKALAEAVAVDVKALGSGKVDNTDPRLTDSREWSADTVPQTEAEAGIASTRRAWTAQRVRQAINAWWQLVTSGFGRNFIAASNEQAARNVLQLGTAATRDVGESSGNVMQVGAFGLGGIHGEVQSYPVSTTQTGFSRFVGSSDPALPLYGMSVVFGGRSTPDTAAESNWLGQLYSNTNTITSALSLNFRVSINGDDWSSPVTLHHTGNIQDATGQSTEYPMTQKAVTDAIANIDVSAPRPVKDHGAVARVGSQTVVCNVQESDFHIMSMRSAATEGTLTIDFANMPDTAGKHFSWHVRLERGGRKTVEFVQQVTWSGGVAPSFGASLNSHDLLMFYKVDSETIRGMLVGTW